MVKERRPSYRVHNISSNDSIGQNGSSNGGAVVALEPMGQPTKSEAAMTPMRQLPRGDQK